MSNFSETVSALQSELKEWEQNGVLDHEQAVEVQRRMISLTHALSAGDEKKVRRAMRRLLAAFTP